MNASSLKKTNYQADVKYSIASLEMQLMNTRQYVMKMHTGQDISKYVRDILIGLLDGFKQEVLNPFGEVIKKNTSLQASYDQIQLLTMEWNRISEVVHLARTNYKDVAFYAPIIAEAQKFVNVAHKTINKGTNEEREIDVFILPYTTGPFSVTSFRYLENLKILNIPVMVAYSPWEWSIFWHEIAGELRTNNAQALKDAYESIEDEPDAGITWSQDWFNELYEDAFSVLGFGAPFIDILHRILSRVDIRINGDNTHPSMEIRIKIACRLLQLFGAPISEQSCSGKELSPFENAVTSKLHTILKEGGFKPIDENEEEWPITNEIRRIMKVYVTDPEYGQTLRNEIVDFVSDNPIIYPPDINIVPHKMSSEYLSSGDWHEDDLIFSWRGIAATLTGSSAQIIAYRYEFSPGLGGGNATRNSDGALINVSWYSNVSGVGI